MSNEKITSSIPQPSQNQDRDANSPPSEQVHVRPHTRRSYTPIRPPPRGSVSNGAAQWRRHIRGRGCKPTTFQRPNNLENLSNSQKNFSAPHFRATCDQPSFDGNPNKLMRGEGSSSATNKFVTRKLIVNPGEDVDKAIFELAYSARKAICVLSCFGSIARARLELFGCKSTYEGSFDIISLSGSWVPTRSGLGRSGGLTIMLTEKDGSIFGGSVSGFLVAESRVEVLVGSFKVQEYMNQVSDGDSSDGDEIAI